MKLPLKALAALAWYLWQKPRPAAPPLQTPGTPPIVPGPGEPPLTLDGYGTPDFARPNGGLLRVGPSAVPQLDEDDPTGATREPRWPDGGPA